jgi:hypothetical protein
MRQVLAFLVLIDSRAGDVGIDPCLYSQLLLRNAGALTSFPQAIPNNAQLCPALPCAGLRDS